MYDAIIGRWISVDPARQFASPYVGMGNNPVNMIDPDGAFGYEYHLKDHLGNLRVAFQAIDSEAFATFEAASLSGEHGRFWGHCGGRQ